MDKIHLIVLAWKRLEYTVDTLKTFFHYNDKDAFHLWYGLDGGYHEALPNLFHANGFMPLVVHSQRFGIAKMFNHSLFALSHRVDHNNLVLMLENDWESVRAVPLDVVNSLMSREDIDSVYLVGRYKERTADGELRREPLLRKKVEWKKEEIHDEEVLTGLSCWTHPPSITRISTAVRLTRGARTELDSIKRSRTMGLKVGWIVDPVFFHIGSISYTSLGGRR